MSLRLNWFVITISVLLSACSSMSDYGQVVSMETVEVAAPSQKMLMSFAAPQVEQAADSIELSQRDQRIEGAIESPAYPVVQTSKNPLSTFSVDVDTAAYQLLLNSLRDGKVPPADSIRTEELINAFEYEYEASEEIIGFGYNMFETPWTYDQNRKSHLLQLHLNARKTNWQNTPPMELVFVLDVSGSMDGPSLELAKRSLNLLLSHLRPEDRFSLITYSDESEVIVRNEKASNLDQYLNSINKLQAHGSTNGSGALEEAYAIAEAASSERLKRIVILTDGDFNFGVSSAESLEDFIKGKRNVGVFLSVIGVVDSYYADERMEIISNHGNGNYVAIPDLVTAEKEFRKTPEQLFETLASDVKIQVEFNPAVVAEYRLIGYQNRQLADEDFLNDRVDAAEMNSGDQVTALYEVILQSNNMRFIPESRYQSVQSNNNNSELGFLKLRYKVANEDNQYSVTEQSWPIYQELVEANTDSQWITGIAATALMLREDPLVGNLSLKSAHDLLASATDGKFNRMQLVEYLKTVLP